MRMGENGSPDLRMWSDHWIIPPAGKIVSPTGNIRAFYKTDGVELRKIRAFYKTDGVELRENTCIL